MNWLFRSHKKKAFTLIELLVVIAIIALLAAILAPAVTRALQKGRVTALVANGSSLYKLFFSRMMDNPLGLQSASGQAAWPSTTDVPPFTDSTTYFATLVTNRTFSLSYNFFAAPGIQPANSETEFLDNVRIRNAWAMTMDVNDQTTMTTPVLFTQNITLNGKNINQFVEPLLNKDAVPFGDSAAVIVYMGGSSFAMESDTALGTNFNPVGTIGVAIYPKNGQL